MNHFKYMFVGVLFLAVITPLLWGLLYVLTKFGFEAIIGFLLGFGLLLRSYEVGELIVNVWEDRT